MRKRKLRRIIALMLCMILVIGCGSISAFAQPEETLGETSSVESIQDAETGMPEESVSESIADETTLDEADSEEETFGETEEESQTESESMTEDTEETGETSETSGAETETGEAVREYVPAEQPLGINVRAMAGPDAFPEGTTMQVTALDEDGVAYEAARTALEDGGVAQDGFRAFDISFYDAEGDEIEPKDGAVQVVFELDKTLLPEEADLTTLAVQHLDETAQGIRPETVAAAADGTLAVDDRKVTADFTVDSFSTFTITWEGEDRDYQVTIQYVNQDGTEISCTEASNVTAELGATVILSDYAYSIDGYVYQGAHLNKVSGAEVTEIKMGYKDWRYGIQYTNDGENWESLSEDTRILLVYNGSTPIDPPTEIEKQLTHDKYVEKNADGTYDLTLTVSGAVGSETKKPKLDVIFVLDKSGSMDRHMSSDYGSSGERRNAAGEAINGLTNALAANTQIDSRFSLVTFSGSKGNRDGSWNDAEIAVGWTSSASEITSSSKPYSNGGTNYQAGLREAKNLLSTRRDDAMTAVIFVSDGNPTYRYNTNGETDGNGSDDREGLNLKAALTEVSNLGANYFFTVGVGPEGNYQKLQDLKDAAALVDSNNRKFYAGTDQTALNAAFDDIKAAITQILCTDVTVTDVLSRNVKMVESNGQPKALKITVKDSEGNIVASGDGSVVADNATLTASYHADTKQITLDFPDDYELKSGYTYLVTATIEATEAAYQAYRENGNAYPDRGDPGTGTSSAGQDGVYTNDEARVDYTFNGTETSEEYAKPVIQLEPGTLVIEKTINGLEDSESIEYLKERLVFEYVLNNGTAVEIPLSGFVYNEATKKYTYNLEGLSPDTNYTVSEKNADISSAYAFDWTSEHSNTSGTVEKGGSQTAVFVNNYTPSDRKLTVEKEVTGNMGDQNKEFNFTLELSKNSAAYTEPLKYSKTGMADGTLASENGVYTFTLKHGETMNLEVPYGCTYIVTEEKTDYKVTINDGTEETNVASGTADKDISVKFVNDRTIHPPTGIFENRTPFIIMTVMAVIAALSFFFVYLKRRDFE